VTPATCALSLPALRQRLVRRLQGQGWVPLADLTRWALDLEVGDQALGRALVTLGLVGVVERRLVETGQWTRTAEYRLARRRT